MSRPKVMIVVKRAWLHLITAPPPPPPTTPHPPLRNSDTSYPQENEELYSDPWGNPAKLIVNPEENTKVPWRKSYFAPYTSYTNPTQKVFALKKSGGSLREAIPEEIRGPQPGEYWANSIWPKPMNAALKINRAWSNLHAQDQPCLDLYHRYRIGWLDGCGKLRQQAPTEHLQTPKTWHSQLCWIIARVWPWERGYTSSSVWRHSHEPAVKLTSEVFLASFPPCCSGAKNSCYLIEGHGIIRKNSPEDPERTGELQEREKLPCGAAR